MDLLGANTISFPGSLQQTIELGRLEYSENVVDYLMKRCDRILRQSECLVALQAGRYIDISVKHVGQNGGCIGWEQWTQIIEMYKGRGIKLKIIDNQFTRKDSVLILSFRLLRKPYSQRLVSLFRGVQDWCAAHL